MENKVLATVAGEEITEAEFNAFLQNVPREQQAYLSNPAMSWTSPLACIFLQRTEPIRSWMRLRSSRT